MVEDVERWLIKDIKMVEDVERWLMMMVASSDKDGLRERRG